MQNLECINFTIHGRVQRVGFRYFTLQIAQQLKLTGFVKNSENGTVTGTVAGEKNQTYKFFLKKFVKGHHCHESIRFLRNQAIMKDLEPFSVK